MYRIKITKTIYFNFCLLLLLSTINQLNAQVINGSFENIAPGCSESGSSDCKFFDFQACTLGWNAFNGSPNNFGPCSHSTIPASHITPFDGERLAGMRYIFSDSQPRNEGIFTNVSITEKSLLTFTHRLFHVGNTIPSPANIQVGLPTSLSPVGSSSGPDPITTTFAGSALLDTFNNFNSLVWRTEKVLINQPTSTTQALAFHPIPTDTTNFASSGGYYAVDSVKIEPCNSFAPDYIFVDAMGIPKTVFCYGEDIFVQLTTVNYFYSSVFFDIWDDLNNPQDYYYIGWVPKTSNDRYNISQLLRDRGNGPINPQGIYHLKMAINHPDCGWITRIKQFAYTCCDAIDAEMTCEIISTDDGVSFSAKANKDYTPYGGSHEFCIYTDLDEDGEFELVMCTSNPSIVANLDRDTRYYITHMVTTACGTVCVNKDFCVGDCPAAMPVEDCDDIADPDCEIPYLDCPTILDNGWSVVLSWTDVGAISYNYEIIFNDPDCGCEGWTWGVEGNVEGNEVLIFIPEGGCYSYRVFAVCEDETISPWSQKRCMNDCEETEDDPADSAKGRSQEFINSNEAIINAYPSPFDNYLNINVEGLKNEKVELRVVDIMGKLLKSETLTTQNQSLNYRWDSETTLTNGIYLIQIIDGGRVYTKKVIRN